MYENTFFLCLIFISNISLADFGEIDLIVHESVENYFNEQNRDVDLKTLGYEGSPLSISNTLEIKTSVKAVQGLTYEWDWHACKTVIQILAPGHYKDLGTECFFEQNH